MYSFSSEVVTGEKLGTTIGFPTLNLKIPTVFPLPYGVYAVKVGINSKCYRGALHFGRKFSLLKKDVVSLEVHVLDFGGSAERLNIEVVQKIRDVKKFEKTQDLRRQIEKDVLTAAKIVIDHRKCM